MVCILALLANNEQYSSTNQQSLASHRTKTKNRWKEWVPRTLLMKPPLRHRPLRMTLKTLRSKLLTTSIQTSCRTSTQISSRISFPRRFRQIFFQNSTPTSLLIYPDDNQDCSSVSRTYLHLYRLRYAEFHIWLPGDLASGQVFDLECTIRRGL